MKPEIPREQLYRKIDKLSDLRIIEYVSNFLETNKKMVKDLEKEKLLKPKILDTINNGIRVYSKYLNWEWNELNNEDLRMVLVGLKYISKFILKN